MNKKILLWILLIAICSLPLLLGIFHPGFFISDDGHWMVIRLSAFYEAVASGQFPVRFLPRLNQGLGYPVADFLYPLFLYIGVILHIFKLPFLLDVKVILGASFIASGIGMYLFLRKSFRNFSSFFGGVAYMYFPYHLYDMYTRGSVGEVVSLAIVPYAFWAIERKSWILTSFLIGFLILAHNTLALFFLPILIGFAYLRKTYILTIVRVVLCGLGIATFFWLPALYDKQFTVFDTINVANPFTYFVNIVSLGLLGWISLTIFGGALCIRNFFKEKTCLFFFSIGVLSIFLSLSMSSIFWHSKLLAEFVQFPFRFLSITILAESFLGAYVIEHLKNKFITIFLFLLLAFSCFPFLLPKQYDTHDEAYYDTNTATTTVQNEYMPKWVIRQPSVYAFQRVLVNDTQVTITNVLQKGTKLSFESLSKTKTNTRIAYAYFPGWQVHIDGKNAVIIPSSPDGLIQFSLPEGKHVVIAEYKETSLQLFADGVSLITFVILGILFIKKKYEK